MQDNEQVSVDDRKELGHCGQKGHLLVSPHFMRGRELSTLVVILSVTLSSREVTFRSSNMNIVCSTATSLSSLIGKVTFYCTFVSREPRKV